MILVIAEKPSVAKTIAEVLGASKKGTQYLYNDNYYVSWCVGHLVSLASPDEYGEQYAGKWSFETLPIIPDKWKFVVSSAAKSQFYVLKDLMQRDDVGDIICATDAGREGECIFRYVYKKAGCKKPVKRLWTSSLERSAIKKAFAELKPDSEYDKLYAAGLARAKADWLVGMNFTRLFSVRYNTNLNIGRVQTPTLAMIVERNDKIKNFTKEAFYKVDIDLGSFKAVSDEQFESKSEADNLCKAVNGSDFSVVSVNKVKKTVQPPKLFDLTSLQREANKIYGYTAQQTLDVLQSLYEKKLATYPRTDSQYITDDMEQTANELFNTVHNVFAYIPVQSCNVKRCINNKKVSDHHAVLPTAEIANCNLNSLPEAERSILFLISVRLCTATAEPHEYYAEKITLTSRNSDKIFSASQTEVLQSCFKAVEACIKSKNHNITPSNAATSFSLPSEGETFSNIPASVSEHFTSPPGQFTDASLLSAMETAGNKDYVEGGEVEKKGLGTPATRASTIEGLVNRGYIVRSGKMLLPTERGISLISCVPNEVKSAKLTADWETVLQGIEKGEASANGFLSKIESFVRNTVSSYSEIDRTIKFTKQSKYPEIGTCPICGKAVHNYPKSYSCENKNCDFVIWKTICGKTISQAQAKKLLSDGRIGVISGFKAKTGKSFSAALKLNSENKVEFVFDNSKRKKG